jgi:hypothetical protein
MHTASPSVASRTGEFTPRELRLLVSPEEPLPTVDPLSPSSERIPDASSRSLDGEA